MLNGKCEVICENDNWKVRFLTSGSLITIVSLNVDVFLVGGGCCGNYFWGGAYYLNAESVGSGIVIFRDKR